MRLVMRLMKTIGMKFELMEGGDIGVDVCDTNIHIVENGEEVMDKYIDEMT